jgi:hypothetical protein
MDGEWTSMHIPKMQINPASEVNALYAAQQAQARQNAEETRGKLFEAASRVAGDSEDCFVTLSDEQQGNAEQQEQEQERKQEEEKPESSAEGESSQLSGWA